jgi:hypothetical protein
MEKKNRKDINTYTKMKLHQNIFLLKLLNWILLDFIYLKQMEENLIRWTKLNYFFNIGDIIC